MSQSRLLSPEEIHTLRAELDGGGTPTVWFTSSAVGVPEGRSGKVVGLDDTNEGDFIQVRPAGSKDVLSFAASEVTLEKPPRKRKEAAATTSRSAPKAPGQGQRSGGSAGAEKGPASKATTGAGPAATAKAETANGEASKPGTAASSQSRSAATAESRTSPPRAQSHAAGKTTASAKSGRRKLLGEATVMVTANESGQWSVEVTTGKKRVLKPTNVSASAVAEAARALHEDVAEAVEPVVEAAREKQRERVEQLQQELAEAQRKLDELG